VREEARHPLFLSPGPDTYLTVNTDTNSLTPQKRGWLRRRLLAWFREHRRDLPWRVTRQAYPIWVSEVMLQQTQVATVIGYFHRFLEVFPTLGALAAADEQQVLKLWEGLGYYRRARDLHRAAKLLVARHGGEIPDDPAALRELPGFGRYTVGAVLSQAFGRRLPILEANSLRVLCRFFGVRDDPRASKTQRKLWQLAEVILPRTEVGDFNQALMELGALVCTPSAPRCETCPVSRHCAARAAGLQEEIPLKPKPPVIEEVREVAVVVRRGRRVFLAQRGPEGRWANMWEFPHGPVDGDMDEAAARFLREAVGLEAEVGPELLTVRHGVTRWRITLVCVGATYRGGEFRPGAYARGVWVDPNGLSAYPISSPQRRLAEALRGQRQGRLF
jgi:A/G-specific adenine glycosylase